MNANYDLLKMKLQCKKIDDIKKKKTINTIKVCLEALSAKRQA